MVNCPTCKRPMQTLTLKPPTYRCEPCGYTHLVRISRTAFSGFLPLQRKPNLSEVPQVFQDAFEGKVLEP